MAYETVDYLRNAIQAELDSRAYNKTNVIGTGTTNKIDEWIEESERAAYREEITRNPAFQFTSTQTLVNDDDANPTGTPPSYSDRFFYPENFLERRQVAASTSNERVIMEPTAPEIILNVLPDTTTRIPFHFAEYQRSLRTVPVSQDVTITMDYFGTLTPILELEGTVEDHYLLNELGEWLKYDACVRGGAYFRLDQIDIDRWRQLRDDVARGVYLQYKRQRSGGTRSRRAIPNKYSITPRRRRGYF